MADTKIVVKSLEIPIPDFEIKCSIGHGAYGEVFLARSQATQRYRAVKVVRRDRFDSDHPYEVEFAGVKLFEEVSREHEGFVDILHVHRDDQAGYFSYVMELADDLKSAQQIDPGHYVPRTLSKELTRRGRLPPGECTRVALALIEALAELHERGLVHRDVKPANIVFVRGAPKLADVGLVTEAREHPPTLYGTLDYMDPEVHGTPAGDLHCFGKVLYTMTTGLPPGKWPDLPENPHLLPDPAVFRELTAIWQKACHPIRTSRYQNADEIRQKLFVLQAGASVVQLKRFELMLGLVRRYGVMLLMVFLALGIGFYFRAREHAQSEELRQRKVDSSVAHGNHAVENRDLLGALSWFAEAWRLDARRDQNESLHRIRLGSVLDHAPKLMQMWFQKRDIKEVFFTSQENQVVMSDEGGQWRVYDLGSGLPLYKPFGKGLPNERVSLCTHGGTAVTSAETNFLCLWNFQTGTQLLRLERPTKLKHAVISPDGRWIAASELEDKSFQTLLLWRLPNAVPIVLGRHSGGTRSLMFSPDSRRLLSCGSGEYARIWDVESNRLVNTFTNHGPATPVYNGAFSPDGRYVVTAALDHTARIWVPETATELKRFHHDDVLYGAEFNSDGTRLATAGLDFTARIWDLAKPQSVQLRHNAKVIRASFSPQDRFLLTASWDDTVRVWHLRETPSPALTDGWLLWGGERSLSQSNGVWSLCDREGKRLRSLTNEPGMAFWFAPNDRHFVVTSPTVASAQCFDAATGRTTGPGISLPPALSSVVISGRGNRVFAFNDLAGAVWDVSSGKRIASFSEGCKRATFSPDGQRLAVAHADRVEVLDLERQGASLAHWSHATNSAIGALEWDPEGQRLITSIWNTSFDPFAAQARVAGTGATAGPPLAHRDGILYAAFNHRGTRAITCGEDYIASLWDPTTGRRTAPPLIHHDQVHCAAFSSDDRLVATVTVGGVVNDAAVTVWSTDTGDPLTLPLPFQTGSKRATLSIRFTTDNRALVINDTSGRSCLWKLPHYQRSLGDLLLTAQLMAAQQMDSTESQMPHSKEALQELWQKLHSKYPEDFALD